MTTNVGDKVEVIIDQTTADAINTARPETNAAPDDRYFLRVTAVKGALVNGRIELGSKSVLATDLPLVA